MFIYQRVIVDSRNSATSVIVWIDQKMLFSHPLNIPRVVSNVLDHSNRPMPNGFQGHTSLNDASCCWLPIAGIPGVAHGGSRWARLPIATVEEPHSTEFSAIFSLRLWASRLQASAQRQMQGVLGPNPRSCCMNPPFMSFGFLDSFYV